MKIPNVERDGNDRSRHALEPARLVGADGLAGPRPALDARELARTVLAVGFAVARRSTAR